MSADASDRRARLEQDRDFLLRSLDDLDDELAAGDLDETDHRELQQTYTARAADVIRALRAEEFAPSDAPDGKWSRTLAWFALVLVVGAAAGILLARFSGSRGSGDSITGDIRATTRERLFDAQQAFADGDVTGAIAMYDEVLAEQPTNVEALAYRGWLRSRTGDPAAAVADLDEAIAIDPEYPDARVFRAIVALDLGDPVRAADELSAYEALDPPPFAQQLLANAQVRERITLARVSAILLVDDPPVFSESGLVVADVTAAAEVLAAEGELLSAVQLFDAVLVEDPRNVEALTYRGWLVARAGDDQLLEGGLEMLDTALGIEPTYAPALVFRAFARNEAGDVVGARADLSAFDALTERPSDLIALIDAFGLRDTLS